MKPDRFFLLLRSRGFDFFTGVPCSYLAPFCSVLEQECGSSDHIRAVREDICLGIASGAYLAGKWPVVYMQNGGLGYSLEVLATLNIIYRIPLLILMSLRGPDDTGMEEHQVMGTRTETLLKTFNINHHIMHHDFNEKMLDEIHHYLHTALLPFCLLIPKGAWV